MESGKFTADEVFYDICSTIFAGLDTSSHALTSILYFLKKNPDVMTKLKSELAKYGITKDLNPEDPTFKDKIERCDYLTYCVKEGLRLDPPLNASIFYEALENIDICGIPIPKGGVIQLHALPPHLNPDQCMSLLSLFLKDLILSINIFSLQKVRKRQDIPCHICLFHMDRETVQDKLWLI